MGIKRELSSHDGDGSENDTRTRTLFQASSL